MKKILGIYVFLILSMCFLSYAFVDANQEEYSNLFTGFFGNYRFQITLIYLSIISSLFLLYIYILRQKINLLIVKQLILVSTILIFSYPSMLSYDIYNYILTSKLTFHYIENPYVVMPIEIIDEPMLTFTHAANKYALYGPFWILLTGLPLLIGFGNLIITIFAFKLFVALFFFLTVFLIYKLTNSVISTVFFAVNPLVIIETFLSGHNDIVMMGLVLLSFYLLLRKKIFIAILFLLASILIKYSTVFLIPLFVLVVFKRFSIEKIGILGFISMFFVFLLSAFRVEIYPWYAIWFLTFSSLALKNRLIYLLSLAFSFSLLLRYVPFMYFGDHFGNTPIIKVFLTFFPPFLVLVYLIIDKALLHKK